MTKMDVDFGKTLDELENITSQEPEYKTSLTMMLYKASKTPLRDWGMDELTRTLGQKIAPEYLIPLSLQYLSNKPMLGGMWYDGDLLKVVLTFPESFYKEFPTIHQEITKVVEKLMLDYETMSEIEREGVDFIMDGIDYFKNMSLDN